MTRSLAGRRYRYVKDRHQLDLSGDTVRGRLTPENIDSIVTALNGMRDLVVTASVLETQTPFITLELGAGWVDDFIRYLP